MSLISQTELRGLQVIAESGMTQTATVLRQIILETDDGQEQVWATVGNDTPCWVFQLTPLAGVLGAISGAVAISQNFAFRCPLGTDVNTGDHVVVEGTTYLVENTSSRSTTAAWLECGCRVLV